MTQSSARPHAFRFRASDSEQTCDSLPSVGVDGFPSANFSRRGEKKSARPGRAAGRSAWACIGGRFGAGEVCSSSDRLSGLWDQGVHPTTSVILLGISPFIWGVSLWEALFCCITEVGISHSPGQTRLAKPREYS